MRGRNNVYSFYPILSTASISRHSHFQNSKISFNSDGSFVFTNNAFQYTSKFLKCPSIPMEVCFYQQCLYIHFKYSQIFLNRTSLVQYWIEDVTQSFILYSQFHCLHKKTLSPQEDAIVLSCTLSSTVSTRRHYLHKKIQ